MKRFITKIIIFLYGTTIMHRNALGQTREVRVKQVLDGEEGVNHDICKRFFNRGRKGNT